MGIELHPMTCAGMHALGCDARLPCQHACQQSQGAQTAGRVVKDAVQGLSGCVCNKGTSTGLNGQHLVSGERLLREGDISRAVSNRPALLLGSQAVALVLRTLGVLAGLAVAVQAVLVHPVAREVLRWLHLATRPAVLQTQQSSHGSKAKGGNNRQLSGSCTCSM